MLQSIGVIIIACVILVYPNCKTFDPLCTIAFAVMVLCTSIPVSRDCGKILMEGSPTPESINSIKNDIYQCGGGNIENIHNLRYWQLSKDKNCVMAHIVVKEKSHNLLSEINIMLKGYHVIDSSLQFETEEEYNANCKKFT